jgi:hypothetical protein
MTTYKPSQVVLYAPPLVGTMHKAESEFGAAMIVRALAKRGDEWRPIPSAEVFEVAREDDKSDDPIWSKLYKNPFFKPDVHKLIADGYARWVEVETQTVEFTEKGFEAMRKWVRT